MAERYTVRLLPQAFQDLDNIYRYIAETCAEPAIAQGLVETLEREILSLEQFPNRCAPRKTGVYANKGYRQLFVKNYTVIFRVEEAEKQVFIVTVRYSASQF